MPKTLHKTPIGLAVPWSLPMLGILLVLCAWNPAGDFWKTVEPPKAQCEAYDAHQLESLTKVSSDVYDRSKLDRLIREPQNTVSNLAYATVGLAILLAGRKPASRSLGLAAIFLGVGSGLYHASLLVEWRLIDILGVYAVLYSVVWLGVCHVFSSRCSKGRLVAFGTIATWALAVCTGVHRNDVRVLGVKVFDSTYVFVAAVTAGSLLALVACVRSPRRKISVRALGTLVLSAAVSFAGGIGDRFGGFWAAPEALVQGHAVWHTFGACAILAGYEVFASSGFDRSTLGE